MMVYCMLFKAAVVTSWTFVEYFIAIPAMPVSLQCSSGFSVRRLQKVCGTCNRKQLNTVKRIVCLRTWPFDRSSHFCCQRLHRSNCLLIVYIELSSVIMWLMFSANNSRLWMIGRYFGWCWDEYWQYYTILHDGNVIFVQNAHARARQFPSAKLNRSYSQRRLCV